MTTEAASRVSDSSYKDGSEAKMPERRARRSVAPTMICQIQVSLEGISPPIWRQIEVPSDITLRGLHEVLQTVMGWLDYHLYQFIIEGAYYGEPDPFEGVRRVPVHHASRTHLRSIAHIGASFTYEYDFGDGWRHHLVIEDIFPPQPGRLYPRCVAGARACPPEDCGGAHGYRELLAILQDPEHEEYQERMEWVNGALDPEAFDLETVNESLKLSPGVEAIVAPILEPDASLVGALGPDYKLSPAERMGVYVRAISAAGSLAPSGEPVETGIRCRRRPKHRRCPGYLNVRRQDIPPQVYYECPVCGQEQGTVSGWKNTEADLSRVETHGAPRSKEYAFVLDPENYETLRSLLPLDPDSERVVYGARRTEQGIRLVASEEDLGALQSFIHLGGEYDPSRPRRRQLIRLFAALAGVIGPER